VLGLLAGEVVVIWFTFGGIELGHVTTGIVALGVNILLAGGAEPVRRATHRESAEVVGTPSLEVAGGR
jgi:hypothetical protein